MKTAPKDRLILLFIPAFDTSCASWWTGCWSWVDNRWSIRTPFMIDNKILYINDAPEPTEWQELPQKI
ncbi:MAG TPA: hypothetical protein ENH49_03675, partial [Candidatus Marinimicrobia bacterium]|nr:hypothetical protein [Candidatus Neomarinimicrobiota bacterium]